MLTDHSKRLRLVEDEPVFVLFLELNLLSRQLRQGFTREFGAYDFRQVKHHAVILKDTFSNDKHLGQLGALALPFFVDILQDTFKILHIAVGIPFDLASRKLKTLVNGKVNTTVGNDNVASLGKGRDDGRDESERLGVDDGGFGTKEFGNARFELLVHV